ncbi:hypothetical protein HDU79_009448 [Rhizoclosmatium sp. JEL0117]|nr:hypothetical protein HDU79_009448 [Rhizoclosmatium sp. JEL0117]
MSEPLATPPRLFLATFLSPWPHRPSNETIASSFMKIPPPLQPLFSAAVEFYYDSLRDDCNDTTFELPVFSRLSPHQRMYDVSTMARALLCSHTPLPTDSIRNRNTLIGILYAMRTALECEIDFDDLDEEDESIFVDWQKPVKKKVVSGAKKPAVTKGQDIGSQPGIEPTFKATLTSSDSWLNQTMRDVAEREAQDLKATKRALKATTNLTDTELEARLQEQAFAKQKPPRPSPHVNAQKFEPDSIPALLAGIPGFAKYFQKPSDTFTPMESPPHPAADFSRELDDEGVSQFQYRRICFRAIRDSQLESIFPLSWRECDTRKWNKFIDFLISGLLSFNPPALHLLCGPGFPDDHPERSALIRRTAKKLRVEYESSWTQSQTVWAEKLMIAMSFSPDRIEQQAVYMNYLDILTADALEFPPIRLKGIVNFSELTEAWRGWNWIREFHAQMEKGLLPTWDSRLKLFEKLVPEPSPNTLDPPVPLMFTFMNGNGMLAEFKRLPQEYWYEDDELRCKQCYNLQPENVKFKACAACGIVRYCSPACQKLDWKNHKPDCLYFRSKKV